jgi:outer membrane protein
MLSAFVLFILVFAKPATADSIIRIIGDKTPNAPESSSGQTNAESPATATKGNTTIRIIGDKPTSSKQEIGQDRTKEIRVIDDKIKAVQNKTPDQPAITDVAVKEQKTKVTAETDSLPIESAERQLSQRLEILKSDEERRIAEKAEQERLAQLKTEKENEAARQAAIIKEQEQLTARKTEELRKALEDKEKYAAEAGRLATIIKEQEQLAARKAEELRKTADKAEQERISALKADEERLAEARKKITEKLRSGTDPVTTSVDRFDPGLQKETESVNSLTPPATIWDLYLSAKANDPALGRTGARVTGSKADSDILFSTLLPHLNSGAGVQKISQTLSDYTPTNSNFSYTAFNYNITAQFTLLNVPTIYSLSAAAAALGMEQSGVEAARQNLIVKFTDSYFALLKAQTDKQIALGEINRLKLVLDQSQAFLKAGTGDIISVYEAQSRLDSAKADLTKSESNLRLAEQKLSSQVGKPVTEVVNYIPQQPVGPDPDNIDWWVTTMEKEQPVLQQARDAVAQTSEQRKAAKAEYLPILQASGGYDVNRGTAALPTAEVRQWFVGANISLPLYSGGETSAKVRRATASEEERKHNLEETMDQQRENVKQAYFNLRYNISLIKALDQRKASAEIQLAAVKKGRKIGTRNAIDVLNAEQAYSLALRDQRYALYDNIIRVIQLKSAAGILAEADISRLSGIEAPTPGNGLNLIISQVSR